MACLLCRRQFPNKDALVRHQQLSDLHKVAMLLWADLTQGGETTRCCGCPDGSEGSVNTCVKWLPLRRLLLSLFQIVSRKECGSSRYTQLWLSCCNVMNWTLTWSTIDTNNVLTSQIRKIQIKFVKSLTQQNMDNYRRSILSEQELEALELREREVNGGQCATWVSWGNCPWLLFVALVPGPRDRVGYVTYLSPSRHGSCRLDPSYVHCEPCTVLSWGCSRPLTSPECQRPTGEIHWVLIRIEWACLAREAFVDSERSFRWGLGNSRAQNDCRWPRRKQWGH